MVRGYKPSNKTWKAPLVNMRCRGVRSDISQRSCQSDRPDDDKHDTNTVQPTCTCVLALVETTTARSHIAASIAISTHAPTARGFEIMFCERSKIASGCTVGKRWAKAVFIGISGLVVEYIVAIDVTRVRFPADAFGLFTMARGKQMTNNCISVIDYKCKQPQPCRTCWGEKRPAGTPCDKAPFQSTAFSYCVFLDACAACLSSPIDGTCGRGGIQMDTLGIEPSMLSGCDTTTPCARLQKKHVIKICMFVPSNANANAGKDGQALTWNGPLTTRSTAHSARERLHRGANSTHTSNVHADFACPPTAWHCPLRKACLGRTSCRRPPTRMQLF